MSRQPDVADYGLACDCDESIEKATSAEPPNGGRRLNIRCMKLGRRLSPHARRAGAMLEWRRPIT
jgi:hypothetical protein